MTALAAFIKNPNHVSYEGEDNDEKIIYILRQSHLTNLGWTIGLAVMAIVPIFLGNYILGLFEPLLKYFSPFAIVMITISWYLAVFGLWLFNFLNWYFNVYIITNKKLVDFDFYGLTYKNISDTPLSNIEDVTAKINGPLRMIFNIGDVYIQTAAEHREFDFANVDDPGKVRDIISDLATETRQKWNN